jgi:hypothetical protein
MRLKPPAPSGKAKTGVFTQPVKPHAPCEEQVQEQRQMRGSLRYATHDKTASGFGRDDEGIGMTKGLERVES